MRHVRDFMSTSIHAVDDKITVHDASVLMADKTISCIIVTSKGKPIGVVTERDLIRKIIVPQKNAKHVKVSSIMSSPLITTAPDDDVGYVSELMKHHSVRRLPVMSEGKIIGIVTQTDVVKETHHLHTSHRRMEFHQNIQSWIVLVALLMTIILLYKILG